MEITLVMLKPRQKAFLKALNKNNGVVKRSAIEAGYSESYADKQGKMLLQSAVKEQAKEIVQQLEGKAIEPKEVKRFMFELVGFSREDILNNIKYLAEQEKDLSTRLKVLTPFAKELGVTFTTDDDSQKSKAPVLNLTVRRVETDNTIHVKSIAENTANNIEAQQDHKDV